MNAPLLEIPAQAVRDHNLGLAVNDREGKNNFVLKYSLNYLIPVIIIVNLHTNNTNVIRNNRF